MLMSKKVVLSLAVSLILFGGIIVLSLTGILIISGEQSFTEPKNYLLYTSIFLTLFLIIFFVFNIRHEPVRNRPPKPEKFTAAPAGTKGLSEGSSPAAGLLASATARYKEGGEKVIIEQDGIHFISSEAFDRDSDTEDKLDGDFKKLVESVVGKK